MFDLKLHENVLKGLETPSRANFDQLVCLKSFLQNKVTIGLLADTNIIPVLFSLLLTYKGPDKNCSRCLSSAGSFSDLPLLCLILENTRLILDYGFRSSDNSNLFSSYFANFNRTKFQEFGESLCQDRKLILRNLNNAFLTSICEKNVAARSPGAPQRLRAVLDPDPDLHVPEALREHKRHRDDGEWPALTQRG